MGINGYKRAIYGGSLILAAVGASWVGAVNSPSVQSLLATQRQVTIQALEDAIARGDDGIGPLPGMYVDDPDETKADDPLIRALWLRLEGGPISQATMTNLLREASAQRQREAAYATSARRLAAEGGLSPTPTTSLQWIPLGPQSALSEWNGSYYDGLDSGRVATVRADPANPARIFIGAIGGGIWRTDDITLSRPVWVPITDTLGTMFIGSFDIDPTDSNVIHVGLGDFWEGNPGGVMVTTTDGGAHWSAPQPLTVTLNGTLVQAVNTRTVRIDPNDHMNVLVASDVGLFRSTNGGGHYDLIDLPNTAAYGTDLEGGFSIEYIGVDATTQKSAFLMTGNYACPGTFPPSFNQPTTGFFVSACPSMTTGNLGDIWKSTDGGATWTSTRVAGALPLPTNGDVGRMNLSAVPAADADAANSVVYALASNQTGSHTVAVMKSVDGGTSWNIVAQGVSTAPTNPATGATGGDCTTMDIGHGQSQYDLTIAADPGDNNSVLIGGNLCGARTVDGGTTWQMVSDWLAFGGNEGPLSYVHADWHHSLVVRVANQPIALAASDGGIFVSYDVFAAARGTDVKWFQGNVGLDTHLPYSVGSGDPTFGTAQYVLTGMQDNGTRFRVSETEAYLSALPQAWNQVQGGDGFGAVVGSDTKGTNQTVWGVANGGRVVCRAGPNVDCTRATRIVNGSEVRAYVRVAPTLPAGDANGGFAVRYAPLYDDAGSVISNSNFNLWKLSMLPGDQPVISRLTTSPAPANPGGYVGCGTTGIRSIRAGGPTASPFSYMINGKLSRVYGLPLSGGCFAVVVDPGNTPVNGVSTVTVVTAATITQAAGQQVQNTGSITFPLDPTHLGGNDITKTYVVSSVGDFATSPVSNPPPPIAAATGHVFMTNDGGNTWTPLHGNGTGFDLPNVRTYVVRFDPSDPTDQTLYAGTDLGFFRSTDLGQTWTRYGSNLPQVRVQDMFVSMNGSLIRVAMYGRGIWEIYPRSDGASGFTGLGDFDKNGLIDFRDVANLANRLTTTPATTETPLYDNEMNLTEAGASTTLDDNDLNALLAKFGGAP
jgi:photosystem II stability/assembly factor-like uncharacterized protein